MCAPVAPRPLCASVSPNGHVRYCPLLTPHAPRAPLVLTCTPARVVTCRGLVAEHYAEDVRAMGGMILLSHHLVGFQGGPEFKAGVGLECAGPAGHTLLKTKNIVTCAGAYSDRLARLSGGEKTPVIVPVRGEYLELVQTKKHLVKGLVYPVPDASVPFLGVHFTPTLGSTVTGRFPQVLVGPNAVFAFSREGYSWFDVNVADLLEAASFPGLWRLAARHFQFALGEMYRSVFTRAQLAEIQKYIPEIRIEDLRRSHAGVRAQALDQMGGLVDDFVFDEACATPLLHVRNAPSPGATSSLAIARMIADKADARFHL